MVRIVVDSQVQPRSEFSFFKGVRKNAERVKSSNDKGGGLLGRSMVECFVTTPSTLLPTFPSATTAAVGKVPSALPPIFGSIPASVL